MIGRDSLPTSAFRWGSILLVASAILVAAVGRMFSVFQPYDDEGYMHYAINAYAAHGGLYERTDSQYGPFFHLVHHGLYLLGGPFTTNAGRVLMLFYWLATVGFCGAIAWTLTRSTAATVSTLGATFLHLTVFIYEPTHPGGMAAALVAALAWIGVRHSERPDVLALTAGSIGAALALTKINVGIFVLAGAGAWWLLHLPTLSPLGRLPAWIAGVLLAILPFALMHRNLDRDWAMTFATVISCSASAVVVVAAGRTAPIARWHHLLPLILAAGAVAVVAVAGVWANGTSLHGILRGVVLDPLRHPGLFTIPVSWLTGAGPVALLAVAGAIASRIAGPSLTLRCVAIARLVAVAAFAAVWIAQDQIESRALLSSYGLALTWLFVSPLAGGVPRLGPVAWLAFLLVPHALQAYPVGGTQLAWATFLWIPLAIAGAHEATIWLGWARAPRRAAVAAGVVVGLTLIGTGGAARYGRNLLKYGDPLGLPDASWVRLPARQASALRTVVLNARAHGDVLFSFPGQLSLNNWSGVAPPTLHNNTHWFTLVPRVEQDAIRLRLEAERRSVVVFNHDEIEGLAQKGVATETPLARWLREAYEPAFRVGAYEFRVRRDRRIESVGTAVARPGDGDPTVSATLHLPAGQAVAAIELHRFKGILTEKVAHWTGADAGLHLVRPSPADLPTVQYSCWEFSGSSWPADLSPADGILFFLDANGRRVAEARLL